MPQPLGVYFIGTGASTPFGLRRMPCVAIKYENYLINFDFGECCQYGLLEHKLKPFKSEYYILITHTHADHIGGLLTYLHTMNLGHGSKIIRIFGPVGIESLIRTLTELFGITQVLQRIRITEISLSENRPARIVTTRKFEIYAFPTVHSVPSIGYIFQEKPIKKFDDEKAHKLKIPRNRLRSLLMKGHQVKIHGRIIRPEEVIITFPGRKIVYTGDTRPIPWLADYIKNADLLIHEATFLAPEHKSLAIERKHSTADEALAVAVNASVKRLALVHISPRYIDNLEKYIEPLKQEALKNNIELLVPNDGDILLIDPLSSTYRKKLV